IETDSPYLAPIPHRGKENQPAYVVEVAAYIAQLKSCALSEVAHKTTENFRNLFLR
ncbi:TatD family hydrolase, partial [Escherichia coli]|nr:TatD family hydrolase [Escherichia coli]MDF4356335.1 TatD family hydrolase [Vibrio parahaemolyticus]